MSPTMLVDALIAALEAERARNPGGDLLGAQEIVVEVAQEFASRERDVARRLEVAITASRLLDAQGIRGK